VDFRTGKADIQQINKFLGALIIGLPTDSQVDFNSYNLKSGQREAKPIESGSFGILNNCWKIDAGEIDKKLHSDPDILLKEEKVLWAFQSGRDVHAYTNRRYIKIDTKGLSGKRVRYGTVPFHQVLGYEFETNGPMDRDAEIYLHTEIPKVYSELPPRRVGGRVAKLSLLVKDVDIYEIGAFFNEHVLFAKEKYAEEPEMKVN
jgi:Bacterial PH domain